MVEGLAKKIGYNKIKAITASRDQSAINEFISKTGLKVRITVSPQKFIENKIEAVPVTIIETTDGRTIRHEGMTENLLEGQPSAVSDLSGNNTLLTTGQAGQKCSGK